MEFVVAAINYFIAPSSGLDALAYNLFGILPERYASLPARTPIASAICAGNVLLGTAVFIKLRPRRVPLQ